MNNRLKECRLKKGYTQQYVALMLGIKSPSVSNWEKGKTFPTTENLAALSRLYDVPLDYLMGGDTKDVEAVSELTADEQEFLKRFKRLSENDKDAILDQMQFLWEYKNRKKP